MSKRTAPVEHPGTFIQEELEARSWQQVDLAYILGMKEQQLNPILNGRQSITPDMATKLGEAFDMPAEFFANLQKLYDLSQTRPADPGIRTRALWAAHFPVRDMIKRQWIEDDDGASELLNLQMLRFFEKDRIEDVPFVGTGEVVRHAARKNSYDRILPAQYAWLHRVMKIARMASAPLFSDQALRQALPEIRSHLLDKDDLIHIPSILGKCGVRYVLVEALPGSKIDGVCVWIDGQPAIGMTLRLDRLDNFAFVLRHEIEHVLRGDGKDVSFAPVDEFDEDFEREDLPPEERRANEEAAEFCVPRKQLESFLMRKGNFISEQDVLMLAARLEVHPGIVVGQIQHARKKYAWLRKYQTSIRNYLLDWGCTDGWGRTQPSGL